VSDAEFVAAVKKVAGVLFKKFGKVHGDLDDFRQQVALWALAALPRYDPARSTLGAYVHRHARFRAMNALRDRITRDDPPCASCHAGIPCDWAGDGRQCSTYARWQERNVAKSNIARPLSASAHPVLVETRVSPVPSAEDTTAAQDLTRLIDRELPVELRADYLKMRDSDVLVPLHRRQRVQRAVADILTAAGVDPPECEPGRSRSAAHPHDDVDGEQERGGDERPAPPGTDHPPANDVLEVVENEADEPEGCPVLDREPVGSGA
jgi:DNA-directed RNA polymerase specialized sigma24 family protein